jgi:hypothetical protein
MPAEMLEILEQVAMVEALAEPAQELIDRLAAKGLGAKAGQMLQQIVNEALDVFQPLIKQLENYQLNNMNTRLEFIKEATHSTTVSESVALALVQMGDLETKYLAKTAEAAYWKSEAEKKPSAPSDTTALVKAMLKRH